MKLLLFLATFWIPTLSYFPRKFCVPETNEACAKEMREKTEILNSIQFSRFPPLSDDLKNYTEKCDNVVKCASGLGCFEKHSEKEIVESVCDKYRTIYHMFEHECFIPFMREVFKEKYNCTKEYQFMMKNFSTHNIFDSPDSCIVKLFQENCGAGYIKFFQANFAELMEIYTSKPDEKSQCDSSSDKFYKMECDGKGVGLESKLKEIGVLFGNFSNTDVDVAMKLCREVQVRCHKLIEKYQLIKMCHEKSCMTGLLKDTMKDTCDNLDAISGNLTRILTDRPDFRECNCLRKTSYFKLLQLRRQCTWSFETKDCWLSVVNELCVAKPLDEFESPKSRLECPTDTPMYGFGNEMFYEAPPRIYLTMREH